MTGAGASAPATPAADTALAHAPTAPLARRLACFCYEGVLLFGVVMAAGLVYALATQQRHALAGQTGLRVFVFVVLGAYFVLFWSRQGQTLAMRTWHIRLVTESGEPPGAVRAALRYLLAWLWFVPALALVHFSGLEVAGPIFATLPAGVLAYAALSRLHPDGQYWHDAACGTRLVHWRPPLERP